VEKYAKANDFFYDEHNEPMYTSSIDFDISKVIPSVAGPKRPQDKLTLDSVPDNFNKSFENISDNKHKIVIENEEASVSDASVVIAAITSCTNTSNPSVMVGAGLIAKNARNKGLKKKPWVKSSLAPGSTVVTSYLKAAGLDKDLEYLGFNTVGYGCTTCIGNSGPLPKEVSDSVTEHDLTVAAVLSGNRNFEGRVHPQVKANYLASPMLVVAYALAGRVDINIASEPIGKNDVGEDIYLKDIWPSQNDISDAISVSLTPEMFESQYKKVLDGPVEWQNLNTSSSLNFAWDKGSTYIQKPPYFDNFSKEITDRSEIINARVLVYLEDSVTTDHISPAGSIPPSAPAGQFLLGNDVPQWEYNSFGSRRGNHNVMARGTFGNIRLRNKLVPDMEGDWTLYFPSDEVMRIYDASEKYKEKETPLIIIAGKEYGTGSSRDWAAKGPMLLGVRAVIAQSFERIHRSNLIGMGVLPLVFEEGESAESIGIDGTEVFDIPEISSYIKPASTIEVIATSTLGKITKFNVLVRIDTEIESSYYLHGGLLPYVLRQMMAE
jgi:aconitate hydratase